MALQIHLHYRIHTKENIGLRRMSLLVIRQFTMSEIENK